MQEPQDRSQALEPEEFSTLLRQRIGRRLEVLQIDEYFLGFCPSSLKIKHPDHEKRHL